MKKNTTPPRRKHKGGTGSILAKNSPKTEDKRQTARQEHTNHFTSRAPEDKQ